MTFQEIANIQNRLAGLKTLGAVRSYNRVLGELIALLATQDDRDYAAYVFFGIAGQRNPSLINAVLDGSNAP